MAIPLDYYCLSLNPLYRFLASEADLDNDIKSLSLLSENTHLYSEFADLGCAGSLVSLLAHENTDIAIDAVEVIAELTDEDTESEQSDWDKLVNAMVIPPEKIFFFPANL